MVRHLVEPGAFELEVEVGVVIVASAIVEAFAMLGSLLNRVGMEARTLSMWNLKVWSEIRKWLHPWEL